MAQNNKKPAARTATETGAKSAAAFASFPREMEQFFFNPNSKSMESIMTQNKSQMDKMAQDASELGRDGYEALIKSSGLFMKGCEEILRTAATIAQSSAEKQAQFIKEALSSKTLNEWTEVQNKMAQANFDDFMSGATQISEMSVKVLTECAEPLNEQMTRTMKKTGTAAAA